MFIQGRESNVSTFHLKSAYPPKQQMGGRQYFINNVSPGEPTVVTERWAPGFRPLENGNDHTRRSRGNEKRRKTSGDDNEIADANHKYAPSYSAERHSTIPVCNSESDETP